MKGRTDTLRPLGARPQVGPAAHPFAPRRVASLFCRARDDRDPSRRSQRPKLHRKDASSRQGADRRPVPSTGRRVHHDDGRRSLWPGGRSMSWGLCLQQRDRRPTGQVDHGGLKAVNGHPHPIPSPTQQIARFFRGKRELGPITSRSMADGLQNRIIDDVSQCYFGFYESASERLGATLAHSREPLVQLLSLAQTWPKIPKHVREALVMITCNVASP